MRRLTTSLASRERAIATASCLLLILGLLTAMGRTIRGPAGPLVGQPDELAIDPAPLETAAPQPTPEASASPPLVDGPAFRDPSETDNSGPPRAVPASAGSTSWFGSRYPAHAAAAQSVANPATTRWALIIGVNNHAGRVRDNVGSRQDAEDLADHLRSLGWRSDHVLLLTDGTATRRHIIEGLAWLSRKTTRESVVVIHYSGHVKQWYGSDVDGDGETTDEALWPSDNQFITDADFSRRVAAVRADRLWVDIGGCEAAGFDDAPMLRDRAVYTFSSEEDEKSYEDPSKSNSVWGWYLVDRGLIQGYGDRNGDDEVSVEEAFNYAKPKATSRTSAQVRGPQHPVIVDRLPGDFHLTIPPPPPPPTQAPPAPADEGPSEGPGGSSPSTPPDEDDEPCLLLLC